MNKNTESKKEQYSLQLDEDSGEMVKIKEDRPERGNRYNNLSFIGYAGEIGYAIVLPILGGTFIGSFIDGRMGTHPKATVIFILFGCIVSVLGLVKTVNDIIKRKN